MKVASVVPLTISPDAPPEKEVKASPVVKNGGQQLYSESSVPSLPSLSGGQLSPPKLPWVGHKQLEKLKASRDQKAALAEGKAGRNQEDWDGSKRGGQTFSLSTQGNSYSHTEAGKKGVTSQPSGNSASQELNASVRVSTSSPLGQAPSSKRQETASPGEVERERKGTEIQGLMERR